MCVENRCGSDSASDRPYVLSHGASLVNDEYASIIKQFLSGPHAEALEWLRSGPGNGRTLGELRTTDQSISLVDRMYALGAEKVIAVGLQDYGDGAGGARYLLVELPEEHRRRDPLFAFEREHAEARGFDGTPDEAQLYLFFDVKGID
jgi:hypothetical protein